MESGNKNKFVQREEREELFRDKQVTTVNRIEGAAVECNFSL
jgi:hypothetical protein